jgi:hypothetical protein
MKLTKKQTELLCMLRWSASGGAVEAVRLAQHAGVLPIGRKRQVFSFGSYQGGGIEIACKVTVKRLNATERKELAARQARLKRRVR